MKFFNHKKPSAETILIFFSKLTTLYSSGIPILNSLDLLIRSETTHLKKILIRIKQDMIAGETLALSLKKYPHYFDELVCNLIQAGEQTGTLVTLLERIILYQQKKLQLHHQIIKILFYPMMVCSISLVLTLFMLLFVVPHFEEFFVNSHKTLPLLTQAVLFFSNSLRNYWYAWLFFLIIGGMLLARQKKRLLELPGIQTIVNKIMMARFARNLATIFASGVAITDALKITATLCGNKTYKMAILKIRQQVISGKQLNQAIATQSIFSLMVVDMIKIGEECGTLVAILEKTAIIYETQIDQLIEKVQQFLEPLIIMILGALIGTLVIAMYLPIFKLGTTF